MTSIKPTLPRDLIKEGVDIDAFGTLAVPFPQDQQGTVHSNSYCGNRYGRRVKSIRLSELLVAEICAGCGGYGYYAGRLKPEQARLMEVLVVLLETKQTTRRMRQRLAKDNIDAAYVTTQHKTVGRIRRRAERALADPKGLNRKLRAEVVTAVEAMGVAVVDLNRPRSSVAERADLLIQDAHAVRVRLGEQAGSAVMQASSWVLVAVADFPALPRELAGEVGKRALASHARRLAAVVPSWAWSELVMKGLIGQDISANVMVWPLTQVPAGAMPTAETQIGTEVSTGEGAEVTQASQAREWLAAAEDLVSPAVQAWVAADASEPVWQQLSWHLSHTTREPEQSEGEHWTVAVRAAVTAPAQGRDRRSAEKPEVQARRREEAQRQQATASLFGHALGNLPT